MAEHGILLVEDSPTDALIVKHALRRRFALDHARSVEEARAFLQGHRYSAIVTDYCLPGGDGISLLRWMRENHIDAPVIVMSGRGDERVAAEALKLGAYDYVVKTEESLVSMGMILQQVLRRHELERHSLILQQIVENASDAIITMQADGRILTANRAVETLFGYPVDAVINHSVSMLFPGAPEEFDAARLLAGQESSAWQGELMARRRDGTLFPAHMSTSILKDSAGRAQCVIGIARDVTERRQLLDRLQRLSVTDNLTGLFNHRFFHDRLQYEFLRARRYGVPLGCIMVDVDFFKAVNDTYGHLTGDEALKSIAAIVTAATRSVDIVARYGGEEFAVLLPNTDLGGTMRCAQHIWENVGTTDIPTGQGPLRLTISVGVASLTSDIKDEAELCRRADDALLAAKRRGRNNVCVWNPRDFGATEEKAELEGQDLAELCESLERLIAPAKMRYLSAVQPLIESLWRRFPELRRHAESVSIYAAELAHAAGLKPQEVEAVRHAALMHDIGKVGHAEDDDSAAPTAQSSDKHITAGEMLLAQMRLLDQETRYVRHHHERYDGGGCPEGLSGSAIPLGARILAVANAYDAILAHIPERTPEAETQAAERLRKLAGKSLDPHLVDLFINTRRAPRADVQ